MKKICLLSFCFTILFLSACSPTSPGLKFPVIEKGICNIVDTSLFIGVPLSMKIVCNELFISDFHAPMVIRYNLNQDTIVERFLSKGKGPHETLPPIILYNDPLDKGRLFFYSKQAFDVGCFLPKDTSYNQILKLTHLYQNVIPLDGHSYLADGYFEDRRYCILDSTGKELRYFGNYPSFLEGEEEIPYSSKAIFHQVDLDMNIQKKKVVAVSHYVLDIIDFSSDVTDKSIRRVLLAPYNYTYTSGKVTSATRADDTVVGAIHVASDESYIYIIFNPNSKINNGLNQELWVMDWEGSPVKKIILDKEVEYIVPAGDHSTLYGIAQNSADYEVVRIKIWP